MGQEESDQAERDALRKGAQLLATFLDTAIRVPGTKISIGVDPLLGLIPGIGDAMANLIGSIIVILGARLGIPKITLIRMNLNLLINGIIGAIPIAGDVFSVWFKSNARNAALLAETASQPPATPRVSDWIFVIGLLTGTLALLFAAIAGILWILVQITRLVQ